MDYPLVQLAAKWLQDSIFHAFVTTGDTMKSLVGTAGITCLPIFGLSTAGSLADIEHVVLFMQENRAFDHVFVLCPLSSLTSD